MFNKFIPLLYVVLKIDNPEDSFDVHLEVALMNPLKLTCSKQLGLYCSVDKNMMAHYSWNSWKTTGTLKFLEKMDIFPVLLELLNIVLFLPRENLGWVLEKFFTLENSWRTPGKLLEFCYH